LSYLKWLEESLSGKLDAKPIGEPVALRAYLELSSDHGHLVPTAAAAAAIAGRWFGAGLPTVYAQGGAGQGYVSITARYPGGQTALIVAEARRGDTTEPPAARLLLIGNKGTIEFADSPGSDMRPIDFSPPSGPAEGALGDAISSSLRSGSPVVPVGGARG
jgi:hypothetical protein